MRSIRMTEGVSFVAETAGAHWLTDVIASHQLDPKVRAEDFQVWTLTVDLATSSGKIVMTDGDKHYVTSQDISSTDFPLPEMVIWFTDQTMLLPGEY